MFLVFVATTPLILLPCALAQEGTSAEEAAIAPAEAVTGVVSEAGAVSGVLAGYSDSVSLIIDGLVRIIMSPVSSVLKLCLTVPCSVLPTCLNAPCYALQTCVNCLSCCQCCPCCCCSPCFNGCVVLLQSFSDACCGDLCQSVSDAAGGMVTPLMEILTGLAGDAARGLLKLPAQ